MVMKAVQQVCSNPLTPVYADRKLIFDVDWRSHALEDLDVLVIDLPPGTGDVQLSLGQLVAVDGELLVLR